MITLLIIFVLFVVLLLSGLPVYLAIGMTSMGLFLLAGHPVAGMAQVMLDHLNSNTLMSVPFFVISAGFMQRGGIAQALIDMANSWVGHFSGGLALVCVLAAMIFSAISGSTTATVLVLGVILLPAMLTRGYQQSFALGIVGATGILGTLIPPSLALIIFGLIAEASIPKLFLAGVIPGLVLSTFFAFWILIYCRYFEAVPPSSRAPARELIRTSIQALPAAVIPIVVLGGIYTGWITIVEAAALAAVLSILISWLVYRKVTVKKILPILAESMIRSTSIMIIIAVAFAFSHWIIASNMPQQLVDYIVGANLSAWHFLLAMNVIMILLGMLLEVVSVILITVPIVLPALHALEIDLIYYGIVVIVNMGLATITPPVGLNLFVLQGISSASFVEILRGIWPYIIILLVLLVLVNLLPALSLWLPNLVYS